MTGSLVPGLIIASSFLLLAIVLIYQLLTHPLGGSINVGPRFLRTIGWTTIQASLSTTLSVGIGILLAWSLSHRRQFIGRRLYIALLSSALVLPTLVVVLGIVTVMGRSGWINSLLQHWQLPTHDTFIYGLGGILIAHCYFNSSYAARALLNRFESIPPEQHKLANSLGLSTWQRFKLTEWPAIASTIPGTAVTIFLLCFTSFAVVLVLGGSPKYNTLEVSIYEAIKLDFNIGRALGLAIAQLFICALLVFLAGQFQSDNKLIAITRPQPFRESHSILLKITQTAILLIFGVAFLLPLLGIIFDGLKADFSRLLLERSFISASITSLTVAFISSLFVLIFSVYIANAHTTLATTQRLANARGAKPLLKLLTFSSTMYLVFPSLVLGLGFFLLARSVGSGYTAWAIAALITSNVLMVLPFSISILAPAMAKAANRYDKLAFSMGLSGLSRWKMVESELIRPELIYIACLTFCMSFGDLGVIALFGNQDLATLPWLLFQKMGSYRTDDAAGIALVMLLITLTVFLLAPRLFGKRNAMPKSSYAEA